MITWGLISGAMMFVKTPTMFYVMRFALGLAEAGLFPGVVLYLTYWFPSERRGKITALFMTGIPMAGGRAVARHGHCGDRLSGRRHRARQVAVGVGKGHAHDKYRGGQQSGSSALTARRFHGTRRCSSRTTW